MRPIEDIKTRDELIEELVLRLSADVWDAVRPYVFVASTLVFAFCFAFFLVKCGVFQQGDHQCGSMTTQTFQPKKLNF
jgi:hypothetical protein